MVQVCLQVGILTGSRQAPNTTSETKGGGAGMRPFGMGDKRTGRGPARLARVYQP